MTKADLGDVFCEAVQAEEFRGFQVDGHG
jgi:hypothetical protein